jgi:hypothetical protein
MNYGNPTYETGAVTLHLTAVFRDVEKNRDNSKEIISNLCDQRVRKLVMIISEG